MTTAFLAKEEKKIRVEKIGITKNTVKNLGVYINISRIDPGEENNNYKLLIFVIKIFEKLINESAIQ